MKIFNTQVYGLNESIIRSGYPHSLTVENFPEDCKYPPDEAYNHLKRGITLGHAPIGSGHDCFLKGIVVQMDITAPQYWWPQFQRYHFADIISSQSKMHAILKMDIDGQCNEYVDKDIIKHLTKLVKDYHFCCTEERVLMFQRIIANCPMGLMLTAGISTNYLQLKTIYHQRKNHKLEEWRIFCEWVESLPKFRELILE